MKIQSAGASLLAAALLFSPVARAQSFEEKVDVNLVLLDVTVTDKKGNQILGLSKDDFIVTEDGGEKSVESLDYFTNRRLLDSPETKAAFKVERVREERYFIIFFDKLLDTTNAGEFRSELLQAKTAAQRFVERSMLPSDRVAVAGFDARLKIYSDFTSDKVSLKKALDDAISFSVGLKKAPEGAGDDSILRNIKSRKMMDDTGRIYDALALLADATRKIPARKVMVLFSPGIGEQLGSGPFLENEQRYYRPMVQALNSANVSVYPVHLRPGTRLHATEQTLSRLASETGGDYYRAVVDYGVPLRTVERENNGYYMLSYRVEKKPGSGFQKVKVSLRNPEFRVRSRAGYPYGKELP